MEEKALVRRARAVLAEAIHSILPTGLVRHVRVVESGTLREHIRGEGESDVGELIEKKHPVNRA